MMANKLVELKELIEERRRLSEKFDQIVSAFSSEVSSLPQDLNSMLSYFIEISTGVKELQEVEGQLKEQIKAAMGDRSVIETENFCASLHDRMRSSVDKVSLTRDYGAAFVEKYLKVKKYKALMVSAKGEVSGRSSV